MQNESASKKPPKRLVLSRAGKLETLLQRLRTLRPEYKNQIALTVHSAIGALSERLSVPMA